MKIGLLLALYAAALALGTLAQMALMTAGPTFSIADYMKVVGLLFILVALKEAYREAFPN